MRFGECSESPTAYSLQIFWLVRHTNVLYFLCISFFGHSKARPFQCLSCFRHLLDIRVFYSVVSLYTFMSYRWLSLQLRVCLQASQLGYRLEETNNYCASIASKFSFSLMPYSDIFFCEEFSSRQRILTHTSSTTCLLVECTPLLSSYGTPGR